MTVLTLHVVWLAHICILHNDEWTEGKFMIEYDIILSDRCDKNDSTHNV